MTEGLLPAGRVTFLLTDIEGSTRTWETDADAMAEAVSEHYAILDEAIARHGGTRPVEQGEGDSVVAVFVDADDALRTALDAQVALTDRLGHRFRVRMALHTGEARLRNDDNYFGPTVIRCARLRGCAHGGQVLLSAATADGLTGLPDEVRLVDLGRHRLRDLRDPMPVLELCHPSLPESGRFAPLRSLTATRPHSIPRQLTRLVGREADVAAVRRALEEHRLVTLLGSGGCGKTRLAAAVGSTIAEQDSRQVWWCDLAECRSDVDLLGAVVRELGVTHTSVESVAEIVGAIGGEGSLLVLDNAEHLVEAVAAVCSEVLARSDVTVLVTSREALAVPGELSWRVPSLDVPDRGVPVDVDAALEHSAVELFSERARGARPGFELTDENVDAVVAICRRLDGIPLALELAAARVRSMAPQQIAAELDERFDVLAGGSRAAVPRHRTLLASVEWSESLLDEAERAVLHRLAVFVGGFELGAARDVVATAGDLDRHDVIDLLARLVDKSLLLLDDTGRYRMLEAVRVFGLDRLAATGALAAARDAHAAWARALARGLGAFDLPHHDRGEALLTHEREWPNLTAAIGWLRDRDPAGALDIVGSLGLIWGEASRQHDAIAFSFELVREHRPVDGDDSELGLAWARAVSTIVYPALANGVDLFELLPTARERLRRAGDERGVAQCDAMEVLRTGLTGTFDAARLDEADRLVERAEANGWRSVGSLAATWPIVNKIALGRLADLDRLQPSDEHTAASVLGYHADGAMLRGELVEASAILSRAQLHLEVSEPHRQRIVVACKQLAALSGGLIDVPVADVPDYDPLDYPGIFQLSHVRHRLIAAYPEARWEVAPPIAEAFTEMRLPVHGRLYEHLVPMLVAAGRADLALPRARDFVDFGARWSAPLFEAVGSLVLSELEADPEAARRALQLAVENRLVLAQIEALELLAVHAHRSGIHDRAALLKASTQAERARRTFLFRWPNRAEVLDEVEVPASVEPVPLERAVEVALRGRGGRGRPALGWSALTPTEVEVATEVAAGATNKEVAARLSMRPSTVKTHLEHIYAKLAVVNRSALASIVTRETPTADG